MFFSIKAYSKESFLKFYNSVDGYKKTFDEQNIIFDEINYESSKITFYSNLTILINGSISNSLHEKINLLIDKNLYIGSDEVGVGESIGPIIVVSLKFKSLKDKKKAVINGIKDSKKLNFQQIKEKAEMLKKFTEYNSKIITPYEFNEIYKKISNVKMINALAHDELHKKWKNDANQIHVIDEFVSPSKYNEYLSKNNIKKNNSMNLISVTKGEEKYLEIAAAAIIAKDLFNSWVIDNLKKENVEIEIKNKLNSWDIFQKIKKNKILVSDKSKFIKNWKK